MGFPTDASGFSSDFGLAFFGTGRFIGDNTNIVITTSLGETISAVFTGQHNYAVSDKTQFPNTDTDVYLYQGTPGTQ